MNNLYIQSAQNLVTTYEATRAGFLSIAFRKSEEAVPFVEEAQALKSIAEELNSPLELINQHDIKDKICDAAGISTKAKNYLKTEDIDRIIEDFIEKYLIPSGNNFADELTYRYLLTMGDSLGGKMRNIVGFLAEEKFTQTIIAQLKVRSISFKLFNKSLNQWVDGSLADQIHVWNSTMLFWEHNHKKRLLVYNKNIPFVGKNVDISLLEANLPTNSNIKAVLTEPRNFIMLGELKGGIDPAGADEHWKTASTSLSRIRHAFNQKNCEIKTFFIGAAIEASMAKEIFEQYSSSILTNCANLTDVNQLQHICKWIVDA